ncbi:hypothetical protein ABKP09_04470 [Peribacillus frigoritolerans]|uniref:hypothetical protein n=1 Tax=Peribacillus frigoritolerans TaxID=450367 RepID=UPI0032B39589
MEFIINKECFNKAISDVSHAVSIKTPIPTLSGIKIVDRIVLLECGRCLIVI